MALFGKKPPASQPAPHGPLPEELQQLIAQAKDERSKISALLGRTRGSMDKLEKMDVPLQEATGRADEIAAKLHQVDQAANQLQSLTGRIDELARRAVAAEQNQSAVEARSSQLKTDLGDLQAVAAGLRESVSAAGQLKAELQEAMGSAG